MNFEWDKKKNELNIKKHNVSFEEAKIAFLDKKKIFAFDKRHSNKKEKRYFCFGLIDEKILTVRFTVRNNNIRIFGAGYWREGAKKYEEENKI